MITVLGRIFPPCFLWGKGPAAPVRQALAVSDPEEFLPAGDEVLGLGGGGAAAWGRSG